MKGNILARVNHILTSEERRKGIILVGLLTIASFFDVISLATFLPILLVIIDPSHITGNSFLNLIYEGVNSSSPETFGIALALVAMLIIFLKTKAITLLTHKKAKFAYSVSNRMATAAVRRFMTMPFAEFTKSDMADELNRITNNPLVFANNIIIPAGSVYAEAVVCGLLFSVVAVTDVLLLLFLFVLIVPVFVLYQLQRKSIRQSNHQIKKEYPELVRNALQAVRSYTEIKSFGKEFFFTNRIRSSYERITGIFATDHTRNTSIGRFTEVAAALVICTIIIYILLFQTNKEKAILLLTIYAGVSFRAIPSINRIVTSIMQIRSHEFSIEEMERLADLKVTATHRNEKCLSFDRYIELQKVAYSYGADTTLLREINLRVEKGQRILIVGDSGTGKTTLLLLLMMFLKPHHGELILDGRVLREEDSTALRKLIGYVSQDPVILNTSILQNIAFGCEPQEIDARKVESILQELHLTEWLKSLPAGINTLIGENGIAVSGGQRQRIALARALYFGAEIFILDETTNQVQPEMEDEIWNLFNQLSLGGKTLIAVSHQLSSRKFFDSVYNLKNGVLAEVPSFTSSAISSQ
jgi:ATP-binding cassette, subfamily B, bacterial PglK